MTIEERRRRVLKFVKDQREYPESDIAIALLEEIFSITDSWSVMATALEEMARAQREQLELHKSMFTATASVKGREE